MSSTAKRILQNSILLLVAILAMPMHGHSQSNTTNKSLLWRISGKNMKYPSYLFGTIHVICKDDFFWTPAMQRGLDQSKELALELDMDDPGLLMQVAQGMINTSGKQLRDYFSTDDYALLEKYVADSVGMSLAGFQQMKPMGIMALLISKPSGCPEPVSYENRIMEMAQKNQIEVTGLETPQEQLDLFDNLPADTVVKEIMKIIKGGDSEDNTLERLTSAYKQQDLPRLHALIQESKDLDMGGFLDTRNEKWIPRMIQKMDQHPVFFAVGAGHLSGEVGLIELLKKEGYKVEAIK